MFVSVTFVERETPWTIVEKGTMREDDKSIENEA